LSVNQELNTPLINQLLEQVGQHTDFQTWRQKGKLPAGIVTQLCQPLRTDSRFIGQPGRFYTSAIDLVDYIYKAWLALQKRLQSQLDRQLRWLEVLQSDPELLEVSGCSLETLRSQAAALLGQLPQPSDTSAIAPGKGKKSKASNTEPSLFNALFAAYQDTDDPLTRSTICYLLKNGCQVATKEENLDKFNHRHRKVEIRVKRLTEQLASRMPKGRDLTHSNWLETLAIAATTAPQDETEAKSWQSALLRRSSTLPFPVTYKSNGDMTWFKNPQGRICIKFNGLGQYPFEIYCDQRQLHWFQRFLEDQQTKRDSKNQHSTSLFTLRSGRIAWQECEGKGDPWNLHRLTLYCTVETRLWTTDGTAEVQQEKAGKITQQLAQAHEKSELNDQQQAYIKRQNSALDRSQTPFPRPSKPTYQGQAHILVGVSLGLVKPATVAIVDAISGKAIAYRSIRQLLGDDYPLLNRQRQLQHQNAHQRQAAQRKGSPRQITESELGQYIDRLLAKAIVTLAKAYRASSIVLPNLGEVRESIHSEIQAKAEQKCPDLVEGQKKYAQQYRSSIHRWSYARLIESIQGQGAQVGISIEANKQPIRGSPQEQAKALAIAAYQSRISGSR